MYEEYYDRVYVYGTPPAQMPAHLWQPGMFWPNPALYTIHPNDPPFVSIPNPSGGPKVQTAPTPRAGTYSGGPANPLTMTQMQHPTGQTYQGLRAARAGELIGGISHNPSIPLGLLYQF